MERFDLLLSLVQKAGSAIRIIHPEASVVDKEGRGNFVTKADKESEKILIDGIHSLFPTDTILSEETASSLTDEELLAQQHLWVIDPLDGTADFRFERNHCAVSVGYVELGIVVCGAVYNPFTHDLYVAQKGKGAQRNNKNIHVGNQSQITHATINTTNAYEPEQITAHLTMLLNIQPSPWILIRGSAALELCEVAAGQADLCFSTILKPWDTAAACIILQEAGAVIKDFSNKPATFVSSHLIVGNDSLVQQFISINGSQT